MHPFLLAALLAAKTAKTTKTSGAGGSFFLIVIIALAILYFFVLRPRSRRARQQQGGRKNLEIGDDVVTAGGIFGRVTGVSGDEIEVEVAPGSTLTFWRRAVNLRSSVAGAPPVADRSSDYDPPAPPQPWAEGDGHYGVEDRFDDGEADSGSEPSGHFGLPDDEASDYDLADDEADGYVADDADDDADDADAADADADDAEADDYDAELDTPEATDGAVDGGVPQTSGERDPGATEGS
jgi:preprotein translocase subunit YajC